MTRRRFLEAAAALPVVGALAGRIAEAREPSVIVLAAPGAADSFYQELRRDILDFDIGFLRAVGDREPILLMADKWTRDELGDSVPASRVLPMEVGDIWLVDIAPVQAGNDMVKFLYRPNYISPAAAGWIEDWFMLWLRETGIETTRLLVKLDGGNLVYDGLGQAVTSEQLYVDNPEYEPHELRAILQRSLGLDRLAVVPRVPGDITGHADGMVTWLRHDLLAVSAFDEPLRSEVLGGLARDLPGVALAEVPYAPTDRQWRGWPDATGVYVNALATDSGFYLPVYDVSADDAALAAFRELAPKPLVPIDASSVAIMGGAVRCLSWYVTGEPAARLLDARG